MTLTRLRNISWAFAAFCGLGAASVAQAASSEDWPNLAAYRQANAALAALPDTTPDTAPMPKGRVVFMGDSITEFWSRAAPAFFANPARIDRGISGQTTGQMLLRFRQDVIALHPRAVVILAGTNDIAGNNGPASDAEIEANLLSMIELARYNHIRVVLVTLVPTVRYPWADQLRPAPRIAAINEWIRAEATRDHLILADIHPAMATPEGALRPELGDDGVHPNAAGYAIMASVIEPLLAKVQK